MKRRSVVSAAAWVYAGYHAFVISWALAVPVSVVGVDLPSGRGSWNLELFDVAILLLSVPLGIGWALWRRREWGRVWFGRYLSVELVLLLVATHLVSGSEYKRRYSVEVPTEWVVVLLVPTGAALIGKLWVQWRLSSPEMREEFVPKGARRGE